MKFLRETLETVIIAAVLALLIRMFVFEPFYVDGPSMEPTLWNSERLIVAKFMYRFSEPRRGDIIVFRYPRRPDTDFVKRVIAVGGETVEIRMGQVYVNGQPLQQNFETRTSLASYPKVEVPQGSVFVLGDNRSNSEDSRYFGFVPISNIKGKALLVYWPLSRVHVLARGL